MEKVDTVQLYIDLAVAMRHWKPQIVTALTYAKHTHTFDDIVKLVMNGQLMLFAYTDAFMIMEIVNYPQFKVWHCFLAGGNHDTIVETENAMAATALDLGCKYLSFSGRRGWDRDAKAHGWEFVSTTMYKPAKGSEQRQ